MSNPEYREYLRDHPASTRIDDRDCWDDPYIQSDYERRKRGDFRTFQEIMRDLRAERRSPENWVYPKRAPGDW